VAPDWCEDLQPRCITQETAHHRACIEHVLEVVEHQEHGLRAQERRKGLDKGLTPFRADAQHLCDRCRNERRIGNRCQVDEPDAIWERAQEICCCLQCQPGLAHAPRAGHGHEPDIVLSKQVPHRRHLGLAADQARRGNWEPCRGLRSLSLAVN